MVVITPPALVGHQEWVDEVLYGFKQKYDVEANRMKDKSCLDRFEQNYNAVNSQLNSGDNIKKILDLINNQQGYDLSPFQRLCLKQMIQCMAQLICGNPPANVLAQYLKKYNMMVARTKMVFMGTSRRGGKTDIMTQVVAAMLIVVPNVKLLFYSIFDITCELACETVVSWITKWGYEHMIYKQNKLKIVLRGEDAGDLRTVVFINGQSVNVKKL